MTNLRPKTSYMPSRLTMAEVAMSDRCLSARMERWTTRLRTEFQKMKQRMVSRRKTRNTPNRVMMTTMDNAKQTQKPFLRQSPNPMMKMALRTKTIPRSNQLRMMIPKSIRMMMMRQATARSENRPKTIDPATTLLVWQVRRWKRCDEQPVRRLR